MAGLLDAHSIEVKDEISALRTELRSIVFARVTDGEAPVFRTSLLPEGSTTDSGDWRLKSATALWIQMRC